MERSEARYFFTPHRTMSEVSAHSSKASTTKAGGIRALIGLLISVICLWWVFSSVETDELFARMRSVDLFWLFLALLTTFCSYLLRSFRWPYFFGQQPPNFYHSYRCLIIGFFMNNVLPARMGELVRAHLGGRATGQSRSTVLATIAGERLADGLMISAMFALAFSFGASLEEQLRAKELFYVSYLFLAATIGTGLVLVFRNKIFRLLEKVGKRMPGHLSSYTLVRIKRFILGLEPLLRPSRLLVLSLFTVAVWLTELLVYYQVTRAFDIPMSIAGLSLFLAAVNFSSLIPAAPGGIGVIEAFASLALVRIGIEHETGLAMVASQHLIQYAVVGIPGAWFFFLTLGGKIPDPDTEEEEFEEIDEKSRALHFADVSEPRPKPPEEPTLEQAPEPPSLLDMSIVIPAFNEEERISSTLSSILAYLETRPEFSCEIIVVDDGSSDKTSEVVKGFEGGSAEVKVLTYPENRGKGYAVRFGVMNARGKRILYNDADGATPIEEIARLEAALDSGVHIAVGSRAMFSRDTQIATVWYRKLMGRVFNGFVNLILLPGIADTQCGFKMFVRKAGRAIFSQQRAERFSFDVEVLFLARKAGYRIAEVPINWTNIPGSKVSLVGDSAAMFLDLLRFRLRDVFGGYGAMPALGPEDQKGSEEQS